MLGDIEVLFAMLKQRSDQAFLVLLCLADLAVTSVCWVGAYVLRLHTDLIPVVGDTPPFWWCVRTLPIVIVVAVLSYRGSGLYQLGRRWPLWQEVLQVFKATTLSFVLLSATTFFMRNPYESRLATVFFGVMTFLGLVLLRRGLGIYFRLRRRTGGMSSKALIVGTGRVAHHVEKALRTNNWLGLMPMGFVDDPAGRVHGTPTVGSIDEIAELVEKYDIDYVFIGLPLRRFGESRRIYRALANTLVEIRLVPDIPQLDQATVHVSQLEGLPILSLRSSPYRFSEVVCKRAMDISLSMIGFVLLSPLFGLVALIIKLTDGGPILYWQERMGLNGHRFEMAKFRTMHLDAEAKTGPVWASCADDRRTWYGAFLRKTSIDELPQLYNVLIGQMSLVGPRPERPYFTKKFRSSIPRYMLRHAVKAGITGWAQVNGWRGNTSLRKRIQYDLYYISNWSLWLDIRILFLTIFRIIWDKNAY